MDNEDLIIFLRKNMSIHSTINGDKLTTTISVCGDEIDSTTVTLPRIPEPTFGPLPKDNTMYKYDGPTLLDLIKIVGDPKVTVSVPSKTDARSTITLNDKGEVESQTPHKVF